MMRSRSRAPSIGLLLLAGLFAAPLAAQDGGGLFCLRGAPLPDCRGFIRVEVRGGGPLSDRARLHFVGTRDGSGAFVASDSIPWMDLGDWIGAEIGYAWNLDERWAVGGGFAIETGNESTRLMARARLRRWLTDRLYAEALPGVFRQERDLLYRSGDGLAEAFGVTAEARAGFAGWAFASARLDVVDAPSLTAPLGTPGRFRYDPGGTAHAFSVGGGLEGPAALVTSAAVGLVWAIAVLFFGGPIA